MNAPSMLNLIKFSFGSSKKQKFRRKKRVSSENFLINSIEENKTQTILHDGWVTLESAECAKSVLLNIFIEMHILILIHLHTYSLIKHNISKCR